MVKSRIGRAAVMLSGLVVAAAAVTVSSGTASAYVGSGCGGRDGGKHTDTWYASACINGDGGAINYYGHTDFPNGAPATIHLWLWDYTAKPGGVQVAKTDFPVAAGPHDYRTRSLAHPASGHDYKAEMRVDWGGGNVDTYLSPDLLN
ncbi:hypothetical protein [Nocardia alni]|uniref:hypothetical protein n=1 Tax=Nocardia alni TaxID=2815723 RepID=UPI001C230F09|nr:hypothetical protein [Nocardia alni]